MRFLINLIILSCSFLFFNNKVFAYNMISLNEFYKKHSKDDKVAAIYALERCSALYGLISNFAPVEQKMEYIIGASVLSANAIRLHSSLNKTNEKNSEKKILNNVEKLQNLYDQDSKTIFNKTGSRFEEYISLDINFCNTVYIGLRDRLK